MSEKERPATDEEMVVILKMGGGCHCLYARYDPSAKGHTELCPYPVQLATLRSFARSHAAQALLEDEKAVEEIAKEIFNLTHRANFDAEIVPEAYREEARKKARALLQKLGEKSKEA